jgi:hypothetical protein
VAHYHLWFTEKGKAAITQFGQCEVDLIARNRRRDDGDPRLSRLLIFRCNTQQDALSRAWSTGHALAGGGCDRLKSNANDSDPTRTDSITLPLGSVFA